MKGKITMKKTKILAALLCLLTICTMATSAFAGSVLSGGVAVKTPDGTFQVLSNNFMYDECPDCDYEKALFYVLDGNVKYYCPDCGATGYAYEAHKTCICGKSCDCKVQCVCGKYVYCGNSCNACGKYVSCSSACGSCEAFYNCWCGKDCSCSVRCSHCGRTGKCGEYCSKCGEYLTCDAKCADCYYGKYDWDYRYDCVCGNDCDCRVQCRNCWKIGDCGEYCPQCGAYLTCNDWCSTCEYDTSATYKILVSTTKGGDYAITGGAYGKNGTVKTLTIEAYDGYEISDVVINGKSYGGDYSEFKIRMVCDYVVKISFAKVKVNQNQYKVTATAGKGGTIALTKNGVSVKNPYSAKAVYGDTLTYSFIPASDNYSVKNVKINGKSVGAKTTYTLSKIGKATTVEVEFEWDCPYSDVSDAHLDAVEYVTEAGIMSSINQFIKKDLFKGTNRVSLKTFAAALAEMADTADELDTVDERIEWAIENGIIDKNDDLKKIVDVKSACDIMDRYLEVLEDENDITFVGKKSSYTAKETCVALKLVSEKAYTKNASITRYDLAELCYAIANLEYVD